MKEMLPDGRAGLPVKMDLAAARSVLPGIWPEKRLEMAAVSLQEPAQQLSGMRASLQEPEEQKLRNRQRKRRSAMFIRKNKKNGSAGLPQL